MYVFLSTIKHLFATYDFSPSLSFFLPESDDCRDTAWPEHRSLDFESLFRNVGGPVGVRAGFCIGGGLADVDWGDGGRCFIAAGEGGRVLEDGLKEENCFVLNNKINTK